MFWDFFYLIQILWLGLSVTSTVSIYNTYNAYNILAFTSKRTYHLFVTEIQGLYLSRKGLFALELYTKSITTLREQYSVLLGINVGGTRCCHSDVRN
jgi:hypothetical protein